MDHKKIREDFLHATFVLSKSDPVAWDGFMQALGAYVAAELEMHVAASSVDSALLMMGMGRRLVELRRDFERIEELEYKRRK